MILEFMNAANRLSHTAEALRLKNKDLNEQLMRERAKNAGVTNELIKDARPHG